MIFPCNHVRYSINEYFVLNHHQSITSKSLWLIRFPMEKMPGKCAKLNKTVLIQCFGMNHPFWKHFNLSMASNVLGSLMKIPSTQMLTTYVVEEVLWIRRNSHPKAMCRQSIALENPWPLLWIVFIICLRYISFLIKHRTFQFSWHLYPFPNQKSIIANSICSILFVRTRKFAL